MPAEETTIIVLEAQLLAQTILLAQTTTGAVHPVRVETTTLLVLATITHLVREEITITTLALATITHLVRGATIIMLVQETTTMHRVQETTTMRLDPVETATTLHRPETIVIVRLIKDMGTDM